MSASYGPTYLLICAFAAWFVGNRFAVILGLFIVAVQSSSGQLINLHTAMPSDIIDLLFQLGSAAAVILMLGVARVALEIEWRFARIDPLTGALNRAAFFEAIEKRATQTGMAVLIFADLDGLKQLNDNLGHERGDDALRTFAERVRGSIRSDDLFARIGGDEFVIFFKVNALSEANLVAERLNKALNLDARRSDTDLACSLGILVLPHGSKNIDAEFGKADALMYQAKRQRSGAVMAVSRDDNGPQVVPFPAAACSAARRPAPKSGLGKIGAVVSPVALKPEPKILG